MEQLADLANQNEVETRTSTNGYYIEWHFLILFFIFGYLYCEGGLFE